MRRSRARKHARERRADAGGDWPAPATARPLGADPSCPLCERPIPAAQRDAHHLVPRSHGGRHTEYLHRICHRQLHALFTEAELAHSYHSVEALLAHPQVQRFVRWVRTRPPGFSERTRKSARVRMGLREG
jgi:5-methylcytosine-specific restriction endonuclease McrA